MIDIRWWVGGLFLLGGMLAMFGLGLAIGRERPSRRAVEAYGLEVSDVEGYDDGDGGFIETASRAAGHAREITERLGAVVAEIPRQPAYADWREQTAAELAPAHLDELAERIDLPGPDTGSAATGEAFSTHAPGNLAQVRAGGLDWPTDTRLPAILTLGQAGDGTDKTFARASLAQWDFMVRFRDERDELDRLLAAGRAA